MPERPLDITSLPHAKEDSRLVLGTVSAPGLPSAAVFALNLAHDGVLAVGGPSGAGKTTALRAVAVAAGLVRVPDDEKPSVCYLDGRDGLGDLDSLPHAEGGGQRTLERTQSVAVDLERLVAERSVMLERGDGPAATFEQHRSEHPGSGLRRVVVLVDDVKAVTAMFDAQHPGRFGELFDRILTDGSRLGVHLVFSVMDRSEIGEERADMVGRWLMLGDGAIGGPRPPGRAVVGNSEVRFATAEIAPVGDADSSAGADSSADAGPVSAAEPDAEQSQGAA
jgi:S-DNA-T family DNA segregation ATPase FtsK/SpoIIIE